MTCEEFRNQLPFLVIGEVSFEEENELESHVLECPACQLERSRMMSLLTVLESGRVGIPGGMLADNRANLRSRISELEDQKPKPAWWREWLAGFNQQSVWLKPAGAMLLLAVGFWFGRVVPVDASVRQVSQTRSESVPMARLRFVSPEESGRVQMVVDEIRRKEFSGDVGDSQVQRLLLAALRDPTDPGLRAETIDLLKERAEDEEVREALLDTLKRDSNPGVRIRALEGLRAQAGDEDMRAVLCEVVLSDDNPAIRAQAIDLLVLHKEPELAGVFQELLRHEENSYVRSRTLKALAEMKASAGTF